MCHCGSTGLERTLNKSQCTKLTLEKKILLLAIHGNTNKRINKKMVVNLVGSTLSSDVPLHICSCMGS